MLLRVCLCQTQALWVPTAKLSVFYKLLQEVGLSSSCVCDVTPDTTLSETQIYGQNQPSRMFELTAPAVLVAKFMERSSSSGFYLD